MAVRFQEPQRRAPSKGLPFCCTVAASTFVMSDQGNAVFLQIRASARLIDFGQVFPAKYLVGRAQGIGFAIFAAKIGFAADNRDTLAEQGQAAGSAVIGRALIVSAAIVATVPARSDVPDREDGPFFARSAGLC